MADQIATLVQEFNGIEQQLIPLQGCENQMANVDAQVSATTIEINTKQGYLNKARADDAHLQKRIYRNENPRFLHYFVCNRPAKIERLKGESQELKKISSDLDYKIAQDSQTLAALQQQSQNAHAVVAQKHQLENRHNTIFDQVVNAQPPTPALQQLHAGVQQNQALMSQEQMLLQMVDNSIAQVKMGLSMFQSAEGLYRQAQQLNERAKQVTRREQNVKRREFRDELRGDEGFARIDEMEKERLEREERRLQAERDSLINRAHDAAMNGYQVLSQAFASFPAEARARYPQQCAHIGHMAFPKVKGANFNNALMADVIFGTWGAAMNDYSSGCKIQDNMSIMEQCISMTSQQVSYISSMHNAVQSNVQQLQSAIQGLEQNILAERSNVFNNVRAAVMAQPRA